MKKLMMIVVMVAAVVLPTMAQQEWQTSTIQTSGSAYSSQVTPVGASSASDMATTTESYSAAPGRPGQIRRGGPGITTGEETTETFDNPNFGPIGDAVVPLLLFAAGFAGVVYLKRRKTAHSDAHVK